MQRRGPTGDCLVLHKVEHDHTDHGPGQKSSDGHQQLCWHFQLRQEPLTLWPESALLLCWRTERRRESYNILTSSFLLFKSVLTVLKMFSLSLLQWVMYSDQYISYKYTWAVNRTSIKMVLSILIKIDLPEMYWKNIKTTIFPVL